MDWAVRTGLVSEVDRPRIDKAMIAWLEALVFHTAPPEILRLAADWTTLFCSIDDEVELLRQGPVVLSSYLSRLFAAFRGESVYARDPIEVTFVDLRSRMLDIAGARWVDRFAGHLEDLFGGYIWEEINRWKRIRPSREAYCEMRTVTIGLKQQFLLGELALGVELSGEARESLDLQLLEMHTCRAVGWANDIHTYSKEVEQGEVHNLVLVLMESESLSIAEAVRRAAAVHDEEVRMFLSVQAKLRNSSINNQNVDLYTGMLRSWIRGHLDWAHLTRRYRASATDAR